MCQWGASLIWLFLHADLARSLAGLPVLKPSVVACVLKLFHFGIEPSPCQQRHWLGGVRIASRRIARNYRMIRISKTLRSAYARPVSASAQRRTKLVATVGPATDAPKMIGRLVDVGVNVERSIEGALKLLVARGALQTGHAAVIISSMTSGEQVVDAVQMRVL